MAESDAEKQERQRREQAEKAAKEGTEAARKSSEETLKEQSGMKPEPSQEDADRMKTGAYRVGEDNSVEQPEGPASRAAQEAERQSTAGTSGSSDYDTRDASGNKSKKT